MIAKFVWPVAAVIAAVGACLLPVGARETVGWVTVAVLVSAATVAAWLVVDVRRSERVLRDTRATGELVEWSDR